ncbi:hypothetical protein D3C74_461320 [compost metagenome]
MILHAKTKYLPYYNGHNTGHYISLQLYNKEERTVVLVDPNNNTAYQGYHNVSRTALKQKDT